MPKIGNLKISFEFEEEDQGNFFISSKPPTVRWVKAKLRNGKDGRVSVVDLGDQLPRFDKDGNMFEAYTTLFRLNSGPWKSSSIDRSIVEAEGPEAREEADKDALFALGVDTSTFRFL